MNRKASFTLVGILVVAAFAAGYGLSLLRGAGGGSSPERKVLYWVDPMNPSFRSSAPGTAPCGMPLEPVYEEGGGASAARPGIVEVRPDRQQLIGVRIEAARVAPATGTVRLLGRVAADERALYRISAVTEGWIREVSSATTGSVVRKDERLASFYSQEVLGPQQAYLYALDALDRFVASGTATPEQLELNRKNVRTTRQILLNLGVSETQADAIAKSRQVAQLVEIRSPASGFVLSRNVSQGQRFDKSTELYAIADLSRVWILADAFPQDADFLRPGSKAAARLPGSSRTFEAAVSPVLPQFDPSTRTLKVRLEAANPGFALRPGMFVDVEAEVSFPAALTVPAAAVLDSGLRKSVYVDLGEGRFEPRAVETGRRLGSRVEIASGLMAGERVVVSGNFLLDSESRMRLAGVESAPVASRDPVCGMDVDEAAARAAGLVTEQGGRSYFFCHPGCKARFDADPASFLARKGPRAEPESAR